MRTGKTTFLFFAVLLLGGYIWFVERNRLSPAEQKAVDRQAFDLPMDRVDRIGIQTAALNVEMVEQDQQWMLFEPAGARASEPVVRQLLARFRSLSRGEFITPADMRTRELTLADFGLEVPQLLLTLGMGKERRVYSVGSPNPLGNALYVKEESSQNIMLVSSDLLDVLPMTEFAYRNPSLFPVSPTEVQELALVAGGQTLRLEREGADWWIRDPVRGKADREDVESLLQKFAISRIEDVVNRPGTDAMTSFEAYNPPEVIRIWPQAQTVPVEVVLGGNVPGNADRCYARITGQEGLVEVSVGLRNLASISAEMLRDRTVIDLAPETIDRIRISEQEDEIVLIKEEGHWKLEKPFSLAASDAKVQNLLTRWQDAIVESFLAEVPMDPGEMESLGQIQFEQTDTGAKRVFTLFDTSPRPGRALILKKESGEWLQVVPDIVKFLPRDPYAFVSRKVVSFDPDQVVRVQMESENASYAILREPGSVDWTSRDADQEVLVTDVQDVLRKVTDLYAANVIPLPSDLEGESRLSIGLGGASPRNLTLVMSGSMCWIQGGSVAYLFTEQHLDDLVAPVTRPNQPASGKEDGDSVTP